MYTCIQTRLCIQKCLYSSGICFIPDPQTDDSDEEEQCALSDKWKYQRSSRRWSRKDLDNGTLLGKDISNGFHGNQSSRHGIRSSSSHDSVITDIDDSLSPNEESPVFKSKTSHDDTPFSIQIMPHPSTGSGHISDSDNSQASSGTSPMSPSLRRSASERFKGASKSFLNRMQSLKTKKGKTKQQKFPANKALEISGPTVVSVEEMRVRMDRLGCVDISPSSEQAQTLLDSLNSHAVLTSSDSGTSGHNAPLHQQHQRSHSITSPNTPNTDPVIRRHTRSRSWREGSPGTGENRLSVYDNVAAGVEKDPQIELDLILKDLYENISGLNKTLGEEDSGKLMV